MCHVAVERPAFGEITVLVEALFVGLGHGIYLSLEDTKAALCLGFGTV